MEQPRKRMEIVFGAMAEPLHEQTGLPEDKCKWLQQFADAVALLVINDVLTDAEGSRARTRILKEIRKAVLKHRKEQAGAAKGG